MQNFQQAFLNFKEYFVTIHFWGLNYAFLFFTSWMASKVITENETAFRGGQCSEHGKMEITIALYATIMLLCLTAHLLYLSVRSEWVKQHVKSLMYTVNICVYVLIGNLMAYDQTFMKEDCSLVQIFRHTYMLLLGIDFLILVLTYLKRNER